jgi:hypothetical protein
MPASALPSGPKFAEAIAGLDYALPGSLNIRYMRCGKRNCRCHADPPMLHGPYPHWTRTIEGRTVTRSLSAEQAERYRPWFDNARKIRELITELEARSVQTFDAHERTRSPNR